MISHKQAFIMDTHRQVSIPYYKQNIIMFSHKQAFIMFTHSLGESAFPTIGKT